MFEINAIYTFTITMKVCNDMREMSCLPKTDPGDI